MIFETGLDLKGEDDELALLSVLETRFAVGLKAGERR